MNILFELWSDEGGAVLAEYALLVSLVAVACIGAIVNMRDQIIGLFNDSAAAMAEIR